MTTRRRTSILIGVSCVALAALYGGLAQPLGYKVEFAGVTMLFALGFALGLMSYVLTSGSSD